MDWIDLGKEIPWLGRDIIYFVDQRAELALTSELMRLGFRIVKLDGEKIMADNGFFEENARALVFPSYFGKNWNAFNDSFGDLEFGPEGRMAIVWTRATVCLRANLHDFIVIVHAPLNAAFGARFPKQRGRRSTFFSLVKRQIVLGDRKWTQC